MRFLNLSAEPDGVVRSWLPPDLRAEAVVTLPDACPGRSPLPTGTAVLLSRPDWRRYAVSDCGCGMRLVRMDAGPDALTPARWNAVADRLRRNKGGLGDLGGGNHFLDALSAYSDERLYVLIHTGSRSESGIVDGLVDDAERFDREFARVVDWARDNRAAVQSAVEAEFGRGEVLLDLPHNTFEVLADGRVIIRKGAVHVRPGDLSVLPSHIAGDVALVRATERVADILYSLSHGTGRSAARGAAKDLAAGFDFAELRARVLLPDGLADSSLRTEGPFAYRDLDPCLELLADFQALVERFAVIGYMGHLG
jgi:RNA-splicing ligase RtcB